MKERPILFSGPMVRAIIDGRKTMTRRAMKPQPWLNEAGLWRWPEEGKYAPLTTCSGRGALQTETERLQENLSHFCPYGQPGDRLWVKETFCKCLCAAQAWACYRAEDKPCGSHKQKWRPSIHMPRWASRITLEVTGVRVERLQDISKDDAVSEGIFTGTEYPANSQSAVNAFRYLWQSLNDKRPGYSWYDNPWVWVVEFKRLQAERGEG